MSAHTALLVGIGSFHGGDAVGWEVARAVERRAVPGWRCALAQTPLDLPDLVTDDVERLIVCDACRSGSHAGQVRRFVWSGTTTRSDGAESSHGWGVDEALLLLQQLGRLPATVEIVAIEIDAADPGSGLSAELLAAAQREALLLLAESQGAHHA